MKYTLLVLLGFILGTLFLLLFGVDSKENQIEYYLADNKKLERYIKFDNVLRKIAGREYVLDEYDCLHFSRDLVRELKKLGINAETIIVDDDFDTPEKHMIVGIWIEPQSGEFVFVNTKYERDLKYIKGRCNETN